MNYLKANDFQAQVMLIAKLAKLWNLPLEQAGQQYVRSGLAARWRDHKNRRTQTPTQN